MSVAGAFRRFIGRPKWKDLTAVEQQAMVEQVRRDWGLSRALTSSNREVG